MSLTSSRKIKGDNFPPFFPAITSSETSFFPPSDSLSCGSDTERGRKTAQFLAVNHLFSPTDVLANWLCEAERAPRYLLLSLPQADSLYVSLSLFFIFFLHACPTPVEPSAVHSNWGVRCSRFAQDSKHTWVMEQTWLGGMDRDASQHFWWWIPFKLKSHRWSWKATIVSINGLENYSLLKIPYDAKFTLLMCFFLIQLVVVPFQLHFFNFFLINYKFFNYVRLLLSSHDKNMLKRHHVGGLTGQY